MKGSDMTAGEETNWLERCEYCGTLDTDHLHGNGHRCCGNCCALHGMLTHPQYTHGEYDFVERIVAYKNEVLAALIEATQPAK